MTGGTDGDSGADIVGGGASLISGGGGGGSTGTSIGRSTSVSTVPSEPRLSTSSMRTGSVAGTKAEAEGGVAAIVGSGAKRGAGGGARLFRRPIRDADKRPARGAGLFAIVAFSLVFGGWIGTMVVEADESDGGGGGGGDTRRGGVVLSPFEASSLGLGV